MRWRERGFANRFVTLEVHGTTDVDARGSEPIHDKRGALVGRCTSGGYGWRLGKSLALAMVRPDLGEIGSEVTVRILVTLSRHSHSRIALRPGESAAESLNQPPMP